MLWQPEAGYAEVHYHVSKETSPVPIKCLSE